MEIIIRPAAKEDVRIIAEAVAMAIGTASVVHYCGEDYMTALQEAALHEGTQYSYTGALVAEVDGQLVGVDGASVNIRDALNRYGAEIDDFN